MVLCIGRPEKVTENGIHNGSQWSLKPMSMPWTRLICFRLPGSGQEKVWDKRWDAVPPLMQALQYYAYRLHHASYQNNEAVS